MLNILQNVAIAIWEVVVSIVETVISTCANYGKSINKAGYVFIGIFAVIWILLWWLVPSLWWLGMALTLWCSYFFRDPVRYVPQASNILVAPADGVVTAIEQVTAPAELEMDDMIRTRISIFLNVFNVHIQRIPIGGVVSKVNYHEGKFLNASLDKASVDNERNSVVVTTEDGHDIIFVQIAGLIARRILCHIEEGRKVETGERYGLIRFGSRVDIYLPTGIKPNVAIGQIMTGGETIIAKLNDEQQDVSAKPI